MRTIGGVPCLQVEEFEDGVKAAPGAAEMFFALRCIHCGCRVHHVDYVVELKVLALRCASCGGPSMNAVTIERGDEPPAPSGIVLS